MSDEIELADDDITGVENGDVVELYVDYDTPYIYLTNEDIMVLARLRGLID